MESITQLPAFSLWLLRNHAIEPAGTAELQKMAESLTPTAFSCYLMKVRKNATKRVCLRWLRWETAAPAESMGQAFRARRSWPARQVSGMALFLRRAGNTRTDGARVSHL